MTRAVEAQGRLERQKAVGLRAAHRIASQGLLRGWETWRALWEETTRRACMLAAAGGRLQRPMLAVCLSAWREEWSEQSAHAQLALTLTLSLALALPAPGTLTLTLALTPGTLALALTLTLTSTLSLTLNLTLYPR